MTAASSSSRGGRERGFCATYRILADDVHRGEFLSPAAEWLLDNFHLIESEIRSVQHDLPGRYYRECPSSRPARCPAARIYAMALELVRHTDSRFDRGQLVRFMAAYQTVAPLTIGELWAGRHAQARAHRKPAAPRRGNAGGRASRLNADRYLDQIVEAGAAGPLPRVLETAYVVRLLQRMREYGHWSPRFVPRWRNASPRRA
jgi:cyclic beta-1,2-glucan synthetase